jgi:hypothetical protein
MEYEGLSNYPTWALFGWITKDSATLAHLLEYWKRYQEYDPNIQTGELADYIRSYYGEAIDETDETFVSVFSDILIWACAQINFWEIALLLIDGFQERK